MNSKIKEKFMSLKAIAVYILVLELWVLLSDTILSRLFYNIKTIEHIQKIKGSICVFLTAYFFYKLVHKYRRIINNLKNELEISEEQYKFIIDSTTEGAWIWNIKNRENALTVKWKDKLGYEEDEVENTLQGWIDLLHPEDKDWVLKETNAYISRKIPRYKLEYRMKKKNGEYMWILDKGQGIWDENGNPICMMGTHTNITERKKAEEQLLRMIEENKALLAKTIEQDRLKTEFFSNMSHEFKTPLNVILGVVQLLSMQGNSERINVEYKKFNRYIDIMKQNCFRLLRLINNLIDITKIDSNFFEISCKNCNIVNMVENITLSVVDFAENQGISIIFDTEVEEKMISCDEDKIERIMLNILSNAMKNTKFGGRIMVNIYDKTDHILLSIKDTGVGIPRDKLKTIFDRFVQVDASLKRPNEGSGIGLSLVKSLVEKQGGEIWVESEVGVGTEFFIKFPQKILPQEEEVARECNYNNLVEKINIEFSDIYAIYE